MGWPWWVPGCWGESPQVVLLFSPYLPGTGSKSGNKCQEMVIRILRKWCFSGFTLASSRPGSRRGQSTFLTGSVCYFGEKARQSPRHKPGTSRPQPVLNLHFKLCLLPREFQGTLPSSSLTVPACSAGGGLRRANATSHSCPANSANTSGCLVLIRVGWVDSL